MADSTAKDEEPGHEGPQPGEKRKATRTALTLREKAIVKSFCEQKVNDCKARGSLVPSQEALRREVATQFGWSCGRSTLSKIISMDWRLLRGSQDGGDAPRNTDMKRRRRPLFPALEADLVKFISAHVDGPGEAGGDEGADRTTDDSQPRGRRHLTEALILEEAQRLKQVHGVADGKLVLSVGWLARFKHRHCIRLRKPANKCSLPIHQQLGVAGNAAESASMGAWSEGLMPPALSEPQVVNEESMQQHTTVTVIENNGDLLAPSSQHAASLELTGESEHPTGSKRTALCAAQWCQGESVKASATASALLEQIPLNIRDLACSCQGSATDDDLAGGISGLRVVVVGFGSVVKTFLAAALVGANGFVTCVEASPTSVYLAEQSAENYCLTTLGLPLVNMKFIVGEYGSIPESTPPSSSPGDGLKELQGQADLVICNCSVQSLEFPASKNAMLGLAFNLLKVGGELRATDLVCSRRLSSSECEVARLAVEASAEPADPHGNSKQFEQKLLLGAPYLGDLQRLYRALSSDIEVRSTSCSVAEAMAIDTAVTSLLPSLAATGDVRFRRVNFRAFRLQDVESPRENYGQSAVFNGSDTAEGKSVGDESSPTSYRLDDDWNFQKGVRMPIDGNTAQILQTSWMERYFTVSGDRSKHHGPFFAGVGAVSSTPAASSGSEVSLHADAVSDAVPGQDSSTPPTSEPLQMVDI